MKLLRHLCQMVVRQPNLFKFRPIVQTSSFVRYKYSRTSGVKGLKGRKINSEEPDKEDDVDETLTATDLFDHSDYDYIANSTMNTTKNILNIQNVLVLQPFIKWGPRKSATKPELALQEAEALVRSIPTWTVEHSIKVPLESLDKQSLFGTGKMEELKNVIQGMRRNGKRVSATKSAVNVLLFSTPFSLCLSGDLCVCKQKYAVVPTKTQSGSKFRCSSH